MKRCSSTSSCALDTSQKVFALRHSLLVGTKITQNAHDAHSHEQWTSTMNNKQWTVSKYYPAQTHLPFVIVSEKAKKIILPPCSIGTVCHALLLSLCTRCTICQHEVCTASIFECFFVPWKNTSDNLPLASQNIQHYCSWETYTAHFKALKSKFQ